jgi:hypothetical protein
LAELDTNQPLAALCCIGALRAERISHNSATLSLAGCCLFKEKAGAANAKKNGQFVSELAVSQPLARRGRQGNDDYLPPPFTRA